MMWHVGNREIWWFVVSIANSA